MSIGLAVRIFLWLFFASLHPLTCFGSDSDTVPQTKPVDPLANSSVLHTPLGTVLRYGEARILLPKLNLPTQIKTELVKGAVAVGSHKLVWYLLICLLKAKIIPTQDPPAAWVAYQLTRSWHYGVRITNLLNIVNWLIDESVDRSINGMNLWRSGGLPIYPGKTLDQAVMIDAKIGRDKRTEADLRRYDIIPLKTVSTDQPLSAWQACIADLVNTALYKNVDAIRLVITENVNVVVTAYWHSRNGVWHHSDLYSFERFDLDRPSFLLDWLAQPYHHKDPVRMMTLLQPETLTCLEQKIRGEDVACQTGTIFRATPVDSEQYRFSVQGMGSHLSILDNQSWSPGLPGVMVMSSGAEYASTIFNESRQYRMPEWLALANKIGLYEGIVATLYRILGKPEL